MTPRKQKILIKLTNREKKKGKEKTGKGEKVIMLSTGLQAHSAHGIAAVV